MRNEYKTDSKKSLLDFMVRHRDRHFTVDEIIKEMKDEGLSPSKSTVYRLVSRLTSDGTLRRFESPDKDRFVYQYASFEHDCEMHFHLKCVSCGKLVHMECEKMSHLREHILSDHGFLIGGSAMINGVCFECSSKEGVL
ncbi:MAG: transcriptional repressor [Ruminococcaceae bacterium]|nr:transcriptional repressor [Oscillospiraceae bacterium]